MRIGQATPLNGTCTVVAIHTPITNKENQVLKRKQPASWKILTASVRPPGFCFLKIQRWNVKQSRGSLLATIWKN
jgi:hypothetical protein